MVKIELKNISKTFGKNEILKDISLEIQDKEYFIILGPTGAGKTTLLKIISGLIKPDNGKVFFDNIDVTNMPPSERNLGFVFENYALFPHMSVMDNISYSGRVKARNKEKVKLVAEEVLMMTLLTGRNDALPNELSGGMQQRVALSRALMNLEQTGLLMLDEPLKALDAGLRNSIRRDIWQMAKSDILQLTTVHVTNDMEEAMMSADRIAILNDGIIEQIGTPSEVYYDPINLFVANFMSEINYFEGTYIADDEPTWNIGKKSAKNDKFFESIYEKSIPIQVDVKEDEVFGVYIRKQKQEQFKDGEKLLIVVRANHMKMRMGHREKEKHNSLFGTIKRLKFKGVFYRFEVLTKINDEDKLIVVVIPATHKIHNKYIVGSEVTVYFPAELSIVFKHPGNKIIKDILKIE